jgi:Fuc2NAc and GlcNAc transferase
MIYIIITVLAFLIAYFVNNYIIKYLNQKKLLDNPNYRSSHTIPTPRGGGLSIFISFFLIFFILFLLELLVNGFYLLDYSFYILTLAVCILGVFEDFKQMPVSVRLVIQTIFAVFVILDRGMFRIFPLPYPFDFSLPFIIAFIFNVVWIVGVMNIYNFLDGIDGYAAVQAILVCIALLFYNLGISTQLVLLILAGSTAGFLMKNWHPAKIFMGDCGAYALGFIFAVLPYYAFPVIELGVFNITILLWFFLSDSLFTILRRLSRREKLWVAHRSHLYQRLNIAGLPHSKIVIIISCFIIILNAAAVINYTYF